MPEINIIDVKNIIKLVKQKYGFDPGIIDPASLTLRLEKLMKNNNISDTDLLCQHLDQDPDFYKQFLYTLFSNESELFRDPEMWIYLRDQVIPRLIAEKKNIRILVCFCTSGSDLYSIRMLVNELGLQKDTQLHYSWPSELNHIIIWKGKLINSQLETSLENMKKVIPGADEKKYLVKKKKDYFFNSLFLKEITDEEYKFNTHPGYRDYDLVIFRNQLLNFNHNYQNLMLHNLVKSLEKNGIMVLVYKENIVDYLVSHSTLVPENKKENIYRKVFNG